MEKSNNSKLEFHIPLILSLALMAAATVPLIFLPCCESEARLMEDSVLFMSRHGIRMVYNCGFVELPDLFSVIFSQIARYLTSSAAALHGIAMIMPLICAWLAYKLGKFFFSVQAGAMSAAIMCVQNIFLAQSGLILPQMMFAACILGSLYLFFREKYWPCAILGTAAALTDTTGLAASLYLLAEYLREKNKEWTPGKNFILLMPLAAWFAYQLSSLIICGKFSMRAPDFSIGGMGSSIWFIFCGQNRIAASAAILAAIACSLIARRSQYFAREMLCRCTAMALILWLANTALGSQESWCLAPVCILSAMCGCAISTLNISYYAKYAIACAIMAASALSLLDTSPHGDAAISYRLQVSADLGTAGEICRQDSGISAIACNSHFRRLLTIPELGYAVKSAPRTISLDSALAYGNCWAILQDKDTMPAAMEIRESRRFRKINCIENLPYANEIYAASQ